MSLLSDFFQEVFRKVRSCSNCGSLRSESFLLCHSCWTGLCNSQQGESLHIFRNDISLEVWSLFRWIPDENRPLSCLIEDLKGGRNKSDFLVLAWAFRRRFPQLSSRTLIFVPAPSREGALDHAEQWAESLAIVFGGRVEKCLRRKPGNSQKELGWRARQKVELQRNENFTQFSDQEIVFADDVVTTGSTAFAAWAALSKPASFRVWSLAYRQPILR